jgi:hypothetical protein
VRPDVTVWYDGRADYFGRERLLEAQQFAESRHGDELVPLGTNCVLLENHSKALDTTNLLANMSQSDRWVVFYRDEKYTVWIAVTQLRETP